MQTLQPSSLNTKDKWAAALEAQEKNARKRRGEWSGKGDKGTSELDHLGEHKNDKNRLTWVQRDYRGILQKRTKTIDQGRHPMLEHNKAPYDASWEGSQMPLVNNPPTAHGHGASTENLVQATGCSTAKEIGTSFQQERTPAWDPEVELLVKRVQDRSSKRLQKATNREKLARTVKEL